MQLIDMIETYVSGSSKYLICKKEKSKCISIVKQYKLQKKTKEHNPACPEISDHPCWILIIGGFGSGKTNLLLNLLYYELDIGKIYLYSKDPYKAK